MTARISLIPGNTRGHRPRLQTCLAPSPSPTPIVFSIRQHVRDKKRLSEICCIARIFAEAAECHEQSQPVPRRGTALHWSKSHAIDEPMQFMEVRLTF